MRRVFGVTLNPHDLQTFLQRAIAAKTVVLGSATAAYSPEELKLEACSTVAAECDVLLLPLGGKRLYSGREGDVRTYFDVIAASEADLDNCLARLQQMPAVHFARMKDDQVGPKAHCFAGSPFRPKPARE